MIDTTRGCESRNPEVVGARKWWEQGCVFGALSSPITVDWQGRGLQSMAAQRFTFFSGHTCGRSCTGFLDEKKESGTLLITGTLQHANLVWRGKTGATYTKWDILMVRWSGSLRWWEGGKGWDSFLQVVQVLGFFLAVVFFQMRDGCSNMSPTSGDSCHSVPVLSSSAKVFEPGRGPRVQGGTRQHNTPHASRQQGGWESNNAIVGA